MEAIAIIGVGCRFPQADRSEAFWQLLQDGVDAVTEVPPERWNIDAVYDPKPGTPGKMNTRWGGFLQQVDQFDPQFFGIAPREAIYMDPQQRLLLEVAWEALEQAGQVPEQLARSQTGVFMGISGNDYQQVLQGGGSATDINAYLGTGNAFSIAANRLSYFFDFRGPSLAIDTACSSSLVAVHLACQSLRSGESNLALAGGVNLLLRPEVTMIFSQAQMMATDGRCKTFDAAANGYVRGEGCGVIVLKRFKDAVRDRDAILALIQGSAINQDGRSNGITAPNGLAQEAVIQQALANADVTPDQIGYVELHGTGTALGDPIEAAALGAVLSPGRDPEDFCRVGSVKTNIGHLEAAAGIAGVIKVALCLQHRQVPASLHFHQPNPYIPLDQLRLKVQQSLQAWPGEAQPALAGISSFGFGGTNAHVILAAAPQRPLSPQPLEIPDPQVYLLPLSARSPEALQAVARTYETFLTASAVQPSLSDLCYTASVRRSHHDHRLSLVFHNPSELTALLQSFAEGEVSGALSVGHRQRSKRAKLVFVFPGQGPQWWQMGRQLWQQEPIFRSALEQCDTLLYAHTGWSLLNQLWAPEEQSQLGETEVAQPALFALQVALVALWRAWGIQPNAVVGHSLGEVAAAYTAGGLTLAEAIRVVYHRSRLMQQGTGLGKMAAVELSQTEAEQWLADYGDRIAIAAINSPTSVVLSGEATALETVLAQLQNQGVFTKLLPVNYAFHSPQMQPFKAELTQSLEGLQPQSTRIPLYSTVTGQISPGEALDAHHWGRNIREPVQFAQAIAQLVADKHTLFIEISPHPVLAGYISQTLGETGVVLPSLRRHTQERAVMLASLGALYTHGYPVDWHKLYPEGGEHVSLPPYPWQRSRYWVETVPELPSQTPALFEAAPQNGSSSTAIPETDTTPIWGLSRQELLETPACDRPQRLEIFYQALLAKVMGIKQVEAQATLLGLGLDSLMAVELHRQIEVHLGVAIAWEEFPGLTTTRFTTLVLQELSSPSSPASPSKAKGKKQKAKVNLPPQNISNNAWIHCPRPNPEARLRLFCFAYAGAGASIFRTWFEELPTEIEVCAIQLPGREDRLGETLLSRIAPLVKALVPILEPSLDLPFALFGHSMGALISFELARELRRQGHSHPTHLFVAGSRAPQLPDLDLPIHRLPEPKFLEALRRLKGIPETILENADLMALLLPVIRADLAIVENYIYAAQESLPCPITAFGGQEDPKVCPADLAAWQDQTQADFNLQIFPSDHFFLHHDRTALLAAIAQTLTQPLVLHP
ncbi:MAG: alpha/beta fold hydrolase [Acaryochloris sp. RU_4_1]|nr:alpha/beta fold hydrolase [Acaryochloris sp. RU_4_1]NJR54279.1 alpha/beta fold hydrolase [Acaryochloris sp. CRU_2_0]